jgi:hypothetical protein
LRRSAKKWPERENLSERNTRSVSKASGQYLLINNTLPIRIFTLPRRLHRFYNAR